MGRRTKSWFAFAAAIFIAPIWVVADPIGIAAVIGDTITLNAIDRGSYGRSGFHNAGDTNYVVGVGDAYRNFFVFDVSGLNQDVIGARLELRNVPGGAVGSAPLILYDVQTAPGTLTSGQLSAAGIFDDLGSGTSFGSAPRSDEALVSVELNADFLNAINSGQSTRFAIGGALGATQGLAFAFAGTGSGDMSDGRAQLVLQLEGAAEPIPLPGVAAGGLVLLGGVAAKRRRP